MASPAIPYDPAFDPPSPRRHAWLWPREHGTYVQLLAPLVAALIARSPTVAGVLFGVAACTAFLTSEAVLISRGARGVRRQALDGARAARRARSLGVIALGTGTVALVLAPRTAIELVGLVALPAALALILAAQRKIHSLGGELIAAIALVGASAPVLAAAGASRYEAVAWWLVWSAGFATTVIAVRSVVIRHRKRDLREREARADAQIVAYILAGLLVVAIPATAIALPLMFASVLIALISPSAKRLFWVGIGLAIAAAGSAALAIALV